MSYMLKKNQLKIIPTEYQEQKTLIEWIQLHPLLKDITIHIPNEYDGGAIRGRHRKLIGVLSGVADIFIPFPTKSHHGLWIELKRNRHYTPSEMAKPSFKNQLVFIERMKKLGYAAQICYGCAEAIETINAYMNKHGS